jgi:hypothetical protein
MSASEPQTRKSHPRLLVCVLVLLPAHALAQPVETVAPGVQDSRPWAAGVPESKQTIALRFYTDGNQEFAESRFAQAITKYKEAIQHWDHPAIRYNLAMSLVELDQLVEARDHLVRSIAHGPAALPAEKHQEALRYRKLLDAQLGHLKITCPEPGSEVTLDGKLLFTGPGVAELFLLPGNHQLVATKPGFLTASRSLNLVAGKLATYDIAPTIEAKPVTRMVRRWERWKPWAVLGSGAGIAALGAATYVLASQQYGTYDDVVLENCRRGCTADMLMMLPEVARQQRWADRVQMVAFSLFSVGGVGIIAGLAGLAMNQPRIQLEARAALPMVTVTPGGLQVSASWRF